VEPDEKSPIMNLAQIADWFTQSAQWSGPDGIPNRVTEHLYYSGLALLIAAVIALPLGLLIGHTGRAGFLVVNSGNAARALPTLGLVGLAVVVWGIGLVPTLVPLVALAVPPILVNTYEGIRQVDAELKDAAKGVGMTGPEVLFRVELPVALPLIILGLRTAAIQIVSTATIAAYVGLGGLGRYIFDGLARREYAVMVGGAVLAVLLALLTEAAFALLARLTVAPGVRQRATTQ
jgi:osmoprotectant transport system permease protein